MEYLAVIEKEDDWWIGWLVDLPGVNAQERTQEELLESLRIGAEDTLDLKGIPDPNVKIMVPVPAGSAVSPSTGRSQSTDSLEL